MSHELQNCPYKLPDGPAYLVKSIKNVWGGHDRYIDQKMNFRHSLSSSERVFFPSIFYTTLFLLHGPIKLLMIDRISNAGCAFKASL